MRRHPQERSWLREQIAASEQRFNTGSVGLFIGRARTDGRTVGLAGFMPFLNPAVIELVYAVADSDVGHGYAMELSQAVLHWARKQRSIQIFHASTDEPNVASIRVLEKLGFQKTREGPGPAWNQLHYRLEVA